ncbi:hypothetical protein [Thermococcus gammatolerans]|uniref:Uncharacterized protein n=1 Tax=Thermococcus gammatolerans (strain DSM 15229 / JCM 11827 / EJ3) TaxID=593117 RepID=C5A3Z8_THEGJ|nr:hypothetical protein [Thermococcus gammatolerans]ACS32960.1 Hypothetical protein TGAM_0458 [Thermococcus gammatolerans EJ3]
MGEDMTIEVKVPISGDELKRLLEGRGRKKNWEKLFGIAKELPEFREEDRVDVRI